MKLINMIFTWKNIITQTILTQLLVIAVVFVAHTSSIKLTLTNHTLYELIISTAPFYFLKLVTSLDVPPNHAQRTDNTKVIILILVRMLFLRFIVSFVLVYVLTTFADNLMLAILGLSNTIVFTIYGVWCTIMFMYLLVLPYLHFATAYALIKSRDNLVERTLLLKVLNGFIVNSVFMSPLILKVGDELRPEWGVMMRGVMFVVFTLPCMFILIIMFTLKYVV